MRARGVTPTCQPTGADIYRVKEWLDRFWRNIPCELPLATHLPHPTLPARPTEALPKAKEGLLNRPHSGGRLVRRDGKHGRQTVPS